MANQNSITIWPPGSNEEPQRGPKQFDAQNVAKFLKNYDDKNLIINPDASGGKLRGLINELTRLGLEITEDGYLTGRRSLDEDGNQFPIINLVFKHSTNKTKVYRAVIPKDLDSYPKFPRHVGLANCVYDFYHLVISFWGWHSQNKPKRLPGKTPEIVSVSKKPTDSNRDQNKQQQVSSKPYPSTSTQPQAPIGRLNIQWVAKSRVAKARMPT